MKAFQTNLCYHNNNFNAKSSLELSLFLFQFLQLAVLWLCMYAMQEDEYKSLKHNVVQRDFFLKRQKNG